MKKYAALYSSLIASLICIARLVLMWVPITISLKQYTPSGIGLEPIYTVFALLIYEFVSFLTPFLWMFVYVLVRYVYIKDREIQFRHKISLIVSVIPVMIIIYFVIIGILSTFER
jgi:hypothetical protein